ncbi:MAG: DsbA family protein [Alphaproteobacteria bacterium]
MTLSIDLFWSFRSPYSYLLLPRIVSLKRDFDIDVDLHVVHPAALRNPAYFARMDPLARPYFLADSARAAAFLGLPFRRPVPDPISQDPITLAISRDQPLAIWLGRLGVAATERGQGLAFADQVSRLLWDGTVTGWDSGDHVKRATAQAGLDLADLTALVAADPAHYDAQLAQNNALLRAAGHWGVPSMVFSGEVFFGQDRFDVLLWRLQQAGLARRGVTR